MLATCADVYGVCGAERKRALLELAPRCFCLRSTRAAAVIARGRQQTAHHAKMSLPERGKQKQPPFLPGHHPLIHKHVRRTLTWFARGWGEGVRGGGGRGVGEGGAAADNRSGDTLSDDVQRLFPEKTGQVWRCVLWQKGFTGRSY